MSRVVYDVVYCNATVVTCRGVPCLVVCIEISCDDIVSVVEKLVEKGGIILVIYVSCGGSGGNIAIGDVKGGVWYLVL